MLTKSKEEMERIEYRALVDVYESQRAELGEIQVRLARFSTKGVSVSASADDINRSTLRARIASAKERRMTRRIKERAATIADESEGPTLAIVMKAT